MKDRLQRCLDLLLRPSGAGRGETATAPAARRAALRAILAAAVDQLAGGLGTATAGRPRRALLHRDGNGSGDAAPLVRRSRISPAAAAAVRDLLERLSPPAAGRGGAGRPAPGDLLGALHQALAGLELRRVEEGAAPPRRSGRQPGCGWVLVDRAEDRKTSGVFYTPATLTAPTVRRTLAPLCYQAPDGDRDAPLARWTPRRPEEILALRICDPAMGTGQFLSASLRFLCGALAASLRRHGRFRPGKRRTRIVLFEGEPPSGATPGERPLEVPGSPATAGFQALLRALLARRILLGSIHGVDIDPLAVDLGRAALWLEAGDPDLDPALLGGRLKVGNSLVGAWSEAVGRYPFAAWAREGGDRGHRGVHFRAGEWTRALRAFREGLRRESRVARPDGAGGAPSAALRDAYDAWCALWFWPADRLDIAPRPASFPALGGEARDLARRLAGEHRFFHWELEFPEVFARPRRGFDAVVGNPPWEVEKPSSLEFFSRLDPAYRSLGKHAALEWQARRFARSRADERAWLLHCARSRALSHWIRHAADPDGTRPFRLQGAGDPNTYKLFLELGHSVLREGGRLGLIVPAGLYTDEGSAELRRLLLDRCRWEWLFSFENRAGLFDIHRSFKFCPVVAEKGGRTDAVRAAFLRREAREWEEAERSAVPFSRDSIERFSPRSLAVLEIDGRRGLEVLEKLYAGSVLLGASGEGAAGEGSWGVRYEREFDQTVDSRLFPPRPRWEERGFRPDGRGRWVGPGGAVALPVYEGRMIDQYDPSAKGWVRGKGRTATWRELPWDDKAVEPQFLMDRSVYREARPGDRCLPGLPGVKLGFMAVGAATNARSMIAACLEDVPCGNSVPVLTPAAAAGRGLPLLALLDSFAYDHALRARLGGQNLNRFIIEETPLVPPGRWEAAAGVALGAIASLALAGPQFAAAWLRLRPLLGPRGSWRAHWALTRHERLRRRCAVEAVAAELYGLEYRDLAWILRDCHHPPGRRAGSPGRALPPKGFWRVDRADPPELRLTVLTLAAFRDLKDAIARAGDRAAGIGRFCAGEGWMPPETLRLADLGLGRGREAREARPVRSRLGERFHACQLGETEEESWTECARLAAGLEET